MGEPNMEMPSRRGPDAAVGVRPRFGVLVRVADLQSTYRRSKE